MMLVIATQDYENYAAHQGFDGTYYWKAKGGSEYKITDIPEHADLMEILALVRTDIEQNNDYFQTIIIGVSQEADDYLSWFEQSQLEYDGEIQFPEPRIPYSELQQPIEDPREYAEHSADLDAVCLGQRA